LAEAVEAAREDGPEITGDLEPETIDGDEWQPDPWADRADSTQVFPTTWTPPMRDERSADQELQPTVGDVRTSLAGAEAAERDGLAPESNTAEQAVPWLIGLILLLAGMVIVLLALIFAGDASLGGAGGVPSDSAVGLLQSGSLVPSMSAAPRPSQSAAPPASTVATPTPVPAPQYGALEMVYQGRSTALAPIYLLRRDFTVDEDPAVMAQDPAIDVRGLAWAPDGRVGAGLLADVLVSIEPGTDKRHLGDGVTTIAFGDDAAVVYAVRVTSDGANDIATVLAIDFASGDSAELASVTYARPDVGSEAPLPEAQFSDAGGTLRLFWTHDDTLRLWALGAGTWAVDPESGEVTELDEALPLLWSADGRHRVEVTADDGTTTLRLTNADDADLATTTVEGLVSHLRWSNDGERVVFTVGRATTGGGVLQDLFLWDLENGEAPMQLTSTGAAFGAEWLGTQPRWEAP
jgi:hypothetical protein